MGGKGLKILEVSSNPDSRGAKAVYKTWCSLAYLLEERPGRMKACPSLCTGQCKTTRYQFSSTHSVKMPCTPAVVILLPERLCRCTLFALDEEVKSCSFPHLFLSLCKPRHFARVPGTFSFITKLIIPTLTMFCQPQWRQEGVLSMLSFPKNPSCHPKSTASP